MRAALIVLLFMFAGCTAPMPPASPPPGGFSETPPPGNPNVVSDAEYARIYEARRTGAPLQPAARGSAAGRTETQEIFDLVMAQPRGMGDAALQRRAELRVPALPTSATAAQRAERSRAVRAEKERTVRLFVAEAERRQRQTAAADEERRRREYCEDLAHDIWVSSAPLSEIIAAGVVGSSRARRLYQQCMDSFRRTDRYLAR